MARLFNYKIAYIFLSLNGGSWSNFSSFFSFFLSSFLFIVYYEEIDFYSLFSHLEKRQTMLFSATQTRKVEDLARLSLKRAPLYVGVDDDKETSTAEGIEQVITVFSSACFIFLL